MGEGERWEEPGLLGSGCRTRPLAWAIAAVNANDFSFVGDMLKRGWCLFRVGWPPDGSGDSETGAALVFMPRVFKPGVPLSSLSSGSPSNRSCRSRALRRLRVSCAEGSWLVE
jgi:hypothetical protein